MSKTKYERNFTMKSIDNDVLAHYNAGAERGRLRAVPGCIEFARTKEILLETLPPAPATIYDIGGAYGEYAFWLAERGYTVHLFDLAEGNIKIATDLNNAATHKLAACEVADARSIDRPGCSADAILLMGPMYHIVERAERDLALRECFRLLKPGGMLYAAAISRFAPLLHSASVYGNPTESKCFALDEPEWLAMCEHEIATGNHILNTNSAHGGLGRSYLFFPDELRDEIIAAGFVGADIRGVINSAWLANDIAELWKDEVHRETLLRIVRLTEREPSLLGLSGHFLALTHKP